MDNSPDELTAPAELSVPMVEVVQSLRKVGMPADMIAETLNVPVVQVRTLLVSRPPSLTPEEQDIASALRKLIMAGINKARVTLEIGTRQEQMQIMKSALALGGRTLAKQDESGKVEAMESFQTLFEQMRVQTPSSVQPALPEAD